MSDVPTPSDPTLDREVEPWLGTFPGLGSITVAQDGSVEIMPESDPEEDSTMRERALRFGWAEGLSLVRRGFSLASGAAVQLPEPTAHESSDDGAESGALILTGDPHDVVIVIAELVERGAKVIADRFTPVQWEQGRLTAYPRAAPVLMASRRAKKLGLQGRKVRADTDALELDVPRCEQPRRVEGVANVGMRRPHETPLTALAGRQKFEAAAGLMFAGALRETSGDNSDAGSAMADHLRLANLPYSNLRINSDTIHEDVDALLGWIAQPDVAPTPADSSAAAER